jgi:cytochrome c-type biogenesis protein CcmH/NrfG
MPSAFAQTMPPTEHFSQSRLTATIVALVAVAFVLAAVFIYLQNGQKVQPFGNVLTAEAKAQYINEMQAVVQSQPAIPADQKAALIAAMSEKLKVNK